MNNVNQKEKKLEKFEKMGSSIIIENRSKMSVTGVLDVISFDDGNIVLDTDMGAMVVHGREFKINKLNVDVGELTIEGELDGFSYEEIGQKKEGFFARMFK